MSETNEDKIEELLKLTRENHDILASMRRSMRWSQFFSYVYWLVILGVMGWSYYFLQPYVEKYWQVYQQISSQLTGIEKGGMSIPADIKGLLEKVR